MEGIGGAWTRINNPKTKASNSEGGGGGGGGGAPPTPPRLDLPLSTKLVVLASVITYVQSKLLYPCMEQIPQALMTPESNYIINQP